MSKIQEIYPDLNCFYQTATEQTASVENPFYPIWDEPEQQLSDVDDRIHQHTQALLEEFAGISEVILSPKNR